MIIAPQWSDRWNGWQPRASGGMLGWYVLFGAPAFTAKGWWNFDVPWLRSFTLDRRGRMGFWGRSA